MPHMSVLCVCADRARPQVSKAWEPRVRASFTSPMAMLATASMWWAMLCSQLGALAGLFPSARLDIVRAMTGFLVPLSQVRRHTRQTYTAEISGLVSLSRAPAAPAGPRLGCPRRASLHASHACLIRPAACICHSIPTQCGKELPRTLLQAGPGAPACYACLVWLRSLASLCVQPGGRRWQGACCRWDKPAWPYTACRWASTACARAQSCGRSESSCAAAAPSRTLLLSRLRCRSCGLVLRACMACMREVVRARVRIDPHRSACVHAWRACVTSAPRARTRGRHAAGACRRVGTRACARAWTHPTLAAAG